MGNDSRADAASKTSMLVSTLGSVQYSFGVDRSVWPLRAQQQVCKENKSKIQWKERILGEVWLNRTWRSGGRPKTLLAFSCSPARALSTHPTATNYNSHVTHLLDSGRQSIPEPAGV